MSRRHCSICKEPHRNSGEGLCDTHLREQEARETEEHNDRADKFTRFLSMSDDARWLSIYDFLEKMGYEP